MSEKNKGALVLYSDIKECDITSPVHPKERMQEIRDAKCARVKLEKYLVWKLLGVAVKEFLNLDFDNLQFTKNDNGQWICPDFYFSLAHTDGFVCAAVSTEPIGVDAEIIRPIKEEIRFKMLTDAENEQFSLIAPSERNAYLLSCWVKKESIFKKRGGAALLPRTIETERHFTLCESVKLGMLDYLISVCPSNKEQIIEIRYLEDL